MLINIDISINLNIWVYYYPISVYKRRLLFKLHIVPIIKNNDLTRTSEIIRYLHKMLLQPQQLSFLSIRALMDVKIIVNKFDKLIQRYCQPFKVSIIVLSYQLSNVLEKLIETRLHVLELKLTRSICFHVLDNVRIVQWLLGELVESLAVVLEDIGLLDLILPSFYQPPF